MSICLSTILDALTELADRSYQERVWAGLAAAEMSSFEECAERLFDDSGLSIALEQGTVFGVEVDGLLRDLSRNVVEFDVAPGRPGPA